MTKKRLFSGIQPTGELHLGNYLGALQNWVKYQDEYEAIYCVVDLHAITIEYAPAELPARIRETMIGLLAVGLDPQRCTLFVQSHVPQHSQLAWLLGTLAPLGDLERMTQFKDKAEQHRGNINLGLFSYPVLQAADILLYRGAVVPVGEDQVQHLELARELARRFNHRFGKELFPEPQPLLSEAKRIRGLDGKTKMSKSLGNTLALTDPPEVIRKKLASAFTDPAKLRKNDPGHPAECNIYALHKYFSPAARFEPICRGCEAGTWGCVDCKRELSDGIISALAPIQVRIADWRARPRDVETIIGAGGDHCRVIAAATLAEVHAAMGL